MWELEVTLGCGYICVKKLTRKQDSEDMAPVKSLIDLWLNPPACTIQLDSAVLYVLFGVTIITMLPCMDRKINKNENENRIYR